MSSDYSPFPPGPPIIHRDEQPADNPEPEPSEDDEPTDTEQEKEHGSDDAPEVR